MAGSLSWGRSRPEFQIVIPMQPSQFNRHERLVLRGPRYQTPHKFRMGKKGQCLLCCDPPISRMFVAYLESGRIVDGATEVHPDRGCY